jgi:HlyD family secretion protein
VSAPPFASHLRRLALGAGEQMRAAARQAAAEARPWLRPENWTKERLGAAWAKARRKPGRALGYLGALVFMGFLLWWLLGATGGPAGIATAAVQEGPFQVTIVEGGTLQALRSVTYASTIQSNQAKIVALAPEGKLVKKGDLLILFDAAPFEEEIRRNQALLEQAQAEQMKAQQDFKLQAIQNQEDLTAARLRVERSDLELKDIQEGKGRLKEEEAVAAVANAERELQKAKSALDDLKPLLAEGFITRTELERAEQQMAKAEEDLGLAKRRRDAFLGFGRPVELSQARSDASQSKETLRQLESAGAFKMEQKRAMVAAAGSRIAEATSKLALTKEQLAKTEVRADVDGIVVYKQVFFGSEQRKPQVGDQVWANQPLLILPDISKMVVDTKIRETDIHKVERNQQVDVRVEAYPDLKLTGEVTLVGTLAQEEKDRRGAKFFGVTILVKETEEKLRPGMSARVEIRVQEREKSLYVPLEAVFEKEGRTFAYVASGRRAIPREVVLGPSNADFVVVEKGLGRGERVCLRDPGAPPSDFGSLTAE